MEWHTAGIIVMLEQMSLIKYDVVLFCSIAAFLIHNNWRQGPHDYGPTDGQSLYCTYSGAINVTKEVHGSAYSGLYILYVVVCIQVIFTAALLALVVNWELGNTEKNTTKFLPYLTQDIALTL